MKSDSRSTLLWAFLISVIVFVFYFTNIWRYDLFSPDEPRYSEVAREAAMENHWIIPHLNNEIYYEKPPLYFDVVALTGLLAQKFTVTIVRIPGIILSALLIFLVICYTIPKTDFKIGILSGLILASAGHFFWMAMKVNLDIPLTFCTTIATFLLFEDIHSPNSRKVRVLPAFFLMGVGTIIKSPISFLPLLPIIAYALIYNKKDALKRIPWFRAFAISLLPAALWMWLAYQEVGFSYIQTTVLDQVMDYSTGKQGHSNPFYYYLLNFPLLGLPWSLFFISALYYVYQFRKEIPPLVAFSVLWFAIGFIVFSILGSKRGIYLLQLYPAFAIITAWFFNKYFKGVTNEKYAVATPIIILAVVFGVLAALVYFKGAGLVEKELEFELADNPDMRNLLIYLFIYLICCALLFASSVMARRKKFVFVALLAFSASLVILLKSVFLPGINPFKSERYLAEDLAAQYEKDAEVGLWGTVGKDSGFIFYNGIYYDKVFSNGGEVTAFLSNPGRQLLIVNKEKKLYQNIPQSVYEGFEIKKYRVGSHNMLLLIEK